MNTNPPGLQLFLLFLRNKKFIISFCLVVLAGAVIFSSSYFIPPQFKSSAIIYPPASYSNKSLLDYDLRFGTDKDIDEHMQILTSSIVRDSILRRFKLFTHYKIDPQDPYKLNSLYEKFNSNVAIDRTRFNSISITVYDTDPKLAAAICNGIIETADEVKSMIIRKNLLSAFHSIRDEYHYLLGKAEYIVKSINLAGGKVLRTRLNAKGDLRAERVITEEYILQSLERGDKALAEKLYNYESLLGEMETIQASLTLAERRLALKAVESYVITPAEVPDKKAFPSRKIIVAGAVFAALIFSLTLAFLLEQVSSLRKAIRQSV